MPKLHARSVMVGSDTLGAVVRIDLIEDDDGRVVPVDYKRGAPPDIPEWTYKPERVAIIVWPLASSCERVTDARSSGTTRVG